MLVVIFIHKLSQDIYLNIIEAMLPQALSEVPGDECGVRHCSLAKPFAYLDPLHRQTDWTDGCIAVTNAEIEEIWKLVPVGTRVEIRP
jgi:hypothetical protein